jgi:hypothetical protein
MRLEIELITCPVLQGDAPFDGSRQSDLDLTR